MSYSRTQDDAPKLGSLDSESDALSGHSSPLVIIVLFYKIFR